MQRTSRMKWPALVAALAVGGGTSNAVAGELAYLGVAEGTWEVWTSDPEGQTPRQLTHLGADVSRISWFPNGRELLVNAHDGRLFRLDAESGDLTPIPPPMPGILDAVVAPDGQRIAFSLSTSGSIDDNDIWVVTLADGALQKLTSMPRLQHEPVWAPDGAAIYFLSGDGGQAHDIWRVDTPTRATEQLTVNALYHFDLAPRADGALAYSGNRSGNYELWLRTPEGQAEQLTDDPALEARPAWSPDGQHLVFESSRGGVMNVWRLDLPTHAVTAVTHTQDGARQPIWAPARSVE